MVSWMDDLTQIAAAGILAVLILREVFSYMKSRGKPEGHVLSEDDWAELMKVNGKILELSTTLVKWHAPDSSGVQEWKNPRLFQAIEAFAASSEKQTEVLTKLCLQMERLELKAGKS